MPWFDGWDQPPGLKVKYEVTDTEQEMRKEGRAEDRGCVERGAVVYEAASRGRPTSRDLFSASLTLDCMFQGTLGF